MANPQPAPHFAPLAVVLDTNVVLDWLVFRDPTSLPLAAALMAGRLHWCATEAMRTELEQVLTREHISRRMDATASPLSIWDTLVRPQANAPLSPLHCRDPDDQKFIDLALHLGNTMLLSRDRAVLALARRAREAGVEITTLAEWSRRQSPPDGT